MTDPKRQIERPMRFAYADPPYYGCGSLYAKHHPEALDWDDLETHRALIQRLADEYPDGWALSMNSTNLQDILPLCPKASASHHGKSLSPSISPTCRSHTHGSLLCSWVAESAGVTWRRYAIALPARSRCAVA